MIAKKEKKLFISVKILLRFLFWGKNKHDFLLFSSLVILSEPGSSTFHYLQIFLIIKSLKYNLFFR